MGLVALELPPMRITLFARRGSPDTAAAADRGSPSAFWERLVAIVAALTFSTGSAEAIADEPAASSAAIRVTDTTGLELLRGVTGGVPIPEGVVPTGSRFLVYGQDQRPTPCQHAILARWKDGSVRWVLLDFQAQPPRNGSSHFHLKWTKDAVELHPAHAGQSQPGERACRWRPALSSWPLSTAQL